MAEVTFTSDKKDIKTIAEYIDKQYFTVGSYLQNLLKENNTISNARDFMEAQRNYTWDKYRASNLIQSVLMRHYVPPIQVYRADDRSQFRKVWDGQQRLTTLYLFMHDLLVLNTSKTRYPKFTIEGEEFTAKDSLNEKKFSDLPKLWQDIIKDFSIEIVTMNNATDEQAESQYIMVNEGVKSLNAAEIRKAVMGIKTRKVFKKYLDCDWILHSIKAVNLEKIGFEIMSQFLALMSNNFEGLELNKDNINDVLYYYRENDITEDQEKVFSDVTDYLNGVFTYLIECKKHADENSRKKKTKNYATYLYTWLTKTNTVMTMYAAYKAMQEDIQVTAFAKWLESFMSNPPQLYKEASGNSSNGKKASDKSSVTDRLDAIEEAINNLKAKAETTQQTETEQTETADNEEQEEKAS